MAIDLNALWDFADPAASERRFVAALATASGDEALILRTQIARTHGLRRDFERARRVLDEVEGAVVDAGPEAQVRFHLERGRTYASGAHPVDALTQDARSAARRSYERALDVARAAELDALAIDALHMVAFVDPAPAEQLAWSEAALDVALNSRQPAARAWEASIRNNVGYALHQLGDFDRALREFEQALAIRERGTNAEATRVARWMVAWTLRSLGRSEEAMQLQLALELEGDAAGKPDPYVYDELHALYLARGDEASAARYAERATDARR